MAMDKKPSDGHLVKAYLSGKEKAFEKLYNRYERPLFSFVLRFVGNRSVAEDLFQQTWMKVIGGLEKYEERGSFSSWLFGIANNCCLDHVRKVSRAKVNDFVSSGGMDQLPGKNRDPEKTVIETEKSEWLQNAISQLPLEQRQVVLMRLTGEIPFKEIAEALNTSINTVLGRMHYAVQSLRKMSKKRYEEDLDHALS
jgi:RNA polymerase sigma-70 factor (ECF subfamily)